jgi:hypothetical protein
VPLGSIRLTVKQPGSVTVVFKLKKSAKTTKLYKRVRRLKLRTLRARLTFTSATQKREVKQKDFKLKP